MSSVRQPSRIYSLEQAVDEAPALATLMNRARRSKTMLEQLGHRIPPGLRTQIQPGPLDDSQWCLLVTSTAAATRIRASTAAALLQPASSSPRANAPDSPKDAADTTASPRPTVVRETAAAECAS